MTINRYSVVNLPSALQEMVTHLFDGDAKAARESMPDVFESSIRKANSILLANEAFIREGYGLTLKDRHRDRWATILQDMTDPTMSRWQSFDRRGFIGHGQYLTAELAIEAAVDIGVSVVVDRGIINELAVTEEWKLGNLAFAGNC